MDPIIIGAIITFVGTVIASIIGVYGLHKFRSGGGTTARLPEGLVVTPGNLGTGSPEAVADEVGGPAKDSETMFPKTARLGGDLSDKRVLARLVSQLQSKATDDDQVEFRQAHDSHD